MNLVRIAVHPEQLFTLKTGLVFRLVQPLFYYLGLLVFFRVVFACLFTLSRL